MKKQPSMIQAAGFAMGIGIGSAVMVGCGIMLGRWIDQIFSIAPWGIVLGIIAGFLAAIWSTYKRLVGKKGREF